MFIHRHSVAALALLAATAAMCPGQSGFGSDGAARVVQMTGQVSVLKDTTPWALDVGGLVQVRQIIVTGPDGFAVFQVSDGSTFEVYPNSRVTFRANPANWKDMLDLWLGRVKVHIEKLSGQPNHNRVRTPTAVISVRGTVFDVVVEDTDSTLVSVLEGQVAVQHALLPSKDAKLLGEGEYLRVYRDQPLAQGASPRRDAAIRQGLSAAAEALYRIIYRAPSAGGAPLPGGGSTGGGVGGGLPGDTETTTPPPPPPPPPPGD